MKRGQLILGVPIVYVILLIVFFLLLIFSYSVITNINEKREQLEVDEFFKNLDNSIIKQSKASFESVDEISILAPEKIEEICFIDGNNFDSLRYKDLTFEKELFSDSNVFSFPVKNRYHRSLDKFELEKNPLCLKVKARRLDISLVNKGSKTLLKSLEGNEKKIDCTGVKLQNVDKDLIDIVYIPYGYKDLNEFKDDVFKYTNNVLFQFEPFSSNKDVINVYMVDVENDLECETKSYVSCDNHQAQQLASQCPHDYIFILANRGKIKDLVSPVRSTAVSNMIRVNTADNENVIVHEFGHIFAGLADEYVDERSYNSDNFKVNQYPNCDDSVCGKWDNVLGSECIKGCTLNSFFRAYDDTIMRSLNEDSFGDVNKKVIIENLEKYK